MTAAFATDPAWSFILGDEYERLSGHFAAALFDLRVVTNTVWVSDDLAAVAMWEPPHPGPAKAENAGRVWRRYRALAGKAATARLTRYNDAVAAAVPARRHWYLGVLATHPSRQGRGLATAVLQPVLDHADRHDLACCLETSTPENRRFYGRRGFTEVTDIELPEGPPTWWLLRPPCP